jgi:SAM-dependent methyltransferase
MNPEEYRNLDHIEEHHWFYAGKREIAGYWLRKCGGLHRDQLLVDCGAGTGRFAAEMQQFCRVLAVDDHEESLQIARSRLGPDNVRRGSCEALPVPDHTADYITALDVLEHVWNDRAAVAEFARILKPAGIAVITVPAMPWLWSDWDVALHHVRRYTAHSLKRLLQHPRLRLIHWNYINVFALPAIWLSRKLRALQRKDSPARIEDTVPPYLLNAALRLAFTAPARQEWLRFPVGVGLLAIVRAE